MEIAGGMAFSRRSSDRTFWIAFVACLGLFTLAVSNKTLWIDEGFISWFVAHRSVGSLLATMFDPAGRPADRQYPLYLLWIWGWARLFGTSEFALRSANLPFAALTILAIALTSRDVFRRSLAWVPFTFAPFLWYYVNEARPYFMLTAFTTVAVAAQLYYSFGPQELRVRSTWVLIASFTLALASHILAAFALPGLAVLMFAGIREQRGAWQEWRQPLLVVGPLLAACIVFYAATIFGGNANSELESNQQHSSSALVYTAEVLYEHVGLAGLGPPRNDLRSGSQGRKFLVWLALGCSALVLAVIFAIRAPIDRRVRPLLVAWLLSLFLPTALSYATHSRFLGRHLAATFPLLLFTALALLRPKASLLLALAVFLASDARLSLVHDYGKDDYRNTVRAVVDFEKAQPGVIDWTADTLTARYYRLAIRFLNEPTYARYVQLDWPRVPLAHAFYTGNLSPAAVEMLLRNQGLGRTPIYLAITKPDIYDTHQAWTAAIDRHHARLLRVYNAFALYVFPASVNHGR